MKKSFERSIGTIKYCGKSVESGMLDARKVSQALIGFDEAIRFFSTIQNPGFQEIDFELPVKIRHGSWEAYIPEAIMWVKATGALASSAYLVKAAHKMTENDFDEIGLKTIICKSVEAIKWVVKIGKHIETLTVKKFEKVKFRKENTEIGIPNKRGEILWVPKEYLEWYSKCPSNLLEKLARLVEKNRTLHIGTYLSNNDSLEEITIDHRQFFLPDKENEILFPELIHDMEVTLKGEVTRGNETANNMGFRYDEHILTAYPKTGSIVDHKESLFLEAEITGKISRMDEKGELGLKKPKIIFTDIKTINKDSKQFPLFK